MRIRLNLESIKSQLFFCVALALVCLAVCKRGGESSDTGNQARSRQDSTDSAQRAAPDPAQRGINTDTDDGVVPALARPRVSGSVKIDSFTDSRDGKTYRAVKIGRQTWMAENLNFAMRFSECYENKEANCEKYGRLYGWDTALKACPADWHLPSDAEWTTLVNYVGRNIAGKKLKSGSSWNKNGNGTNDYGFSALPGGDGFGAVYLAGNYGLWWSATEFNAKYAWYRDMTYKYEGVGRDFHSKINAFSVRCVQDDAGSAQSAAPAPAQQSNTGSAQSSVSTPNLKGAFSIQIMADDNIDSVRKEKIKAEAAINPPLFMVLVQSLYKLYVGDFNTKAEAEAFLPTVKSNGYMDAWIVSTRDNKLVNATGETWRTEYVEIEYSLNFRSNGTFTEEEEWPCDDGDCDYKGSGKWYTIGNNITMIYSDGRKTENPYTLTNGVNENGKKGYRLKIGDSEKGYYKYAKGEWRNYK